ncbi:NUDIX hydrolase [Rhodopila globiformis]|uniref:hypothetical protein n=1 Tax=Rhodopila globiformis TaxID=1071 RepID=UPI0011B04C5B|nr:hypothetical protein [Rhodopila globiformis]
MSQPTSALLYRYEKRHSDGAPATFEVSVFLFAVERQLRKWPEKTERKTRWYDIGTASELVTPADLGEVLRHTARRLMVTPSRAGQLPDSVGEEHEGPGVPPMG